VPSQQRSTRAFHDPRINPDPSRVFRRRPREPTSENAALVSATAAERLSRESPRSRGPGVSAVFLKPMLRQARIYVPSGTDVPGHDTASRTGSVTVGSARVSGVVTSNRRR
jgi:hypothetical protein